MKQCKSCVKEIDDLAIKCPFCQAYQSWTKNPQNLGWLMAFPIIGYSFWNISSIRSHSFAKYKDEIILTELNQRVNDEERQINYSVINASEIKWGKLKYQIIGYAKDGAVITTRDFDNYSWVIGGNSSAYLTVTIPDHPQVVKWETVLKDLDSSRF